MQQPAASATQTADSATDILVCAIWFGLMAGILEGVADLTVRHMQALDLVWITSAAYAVLFAVLAVEFILILKLRPGSPALAGAVFFFSFCITLLTLRLFLVPSIRQALPWLVSLAIAWVVVWAFSRYRTAFLRVQRRSLLSIACGLFVFAAAVLAGDSYRESRGLAALRAAAPGAPNVLVIIVDTLRADHLSAYGYPRPTSPNIAQLAARGVLFENAIAPSAWTLPSHASMVTGRYPHDHGADTFSKSMDGRYATVAEAFQARGYRTGAFSANLAWFSRSSGLDRGFLHFEDYRQSASSAASRTYLGERLVAACYVLSLCGGLPGRLTAEEINAHALRWLDSDKRPFLVFLNYMDTHEPYLPPSPYREAFTLGSRKRILQGFQPELAPEQLQGEIGAYDGAIAAVDARVGQLLRELATRGLDRNTLVILTSDHGEGFDEHGLLGHLNSLYRELLHVPLIFSWPGRLPEGVRIAAPVSTASLPATLASIVAEHWDTQFPGPSLASLWEGGARSWPDPLSELAQMDGSPKDINFRGSLDSVFTSEWHYIRGPGARRELYSVLQDSREDHNLADTAQGQEVCRRLDHEMLIARRPAGAANDGSGSPTSP